MEKYKVSAIILKAAKEKGIMVSDELMDSVLNLVEENPYITKYISIFGKMFTDEYLQDSIKKDEICSEIFSEDFQPMEFIFAHMGLKLNPYTKAITPSLKKIQEVAEISSIQSL